MANHHHHRKPTLSPELALASDLFDNFCGATTLKTVLSNYRSLCEILNIKPTNFPQFYPKLKSKLCSWRAQALWNKFDKRANHKCYNRGKACPNTRVLIIGAGPCGLRAAIEAQLLGAKVVVIEKRDRITRNNVLHLWPFVIQDLRSLGAKKFFGKFCAGSIDHISIRQLQCILLKVALLLGVEIHEGISFESLIPPSSNDEERIGWRAKIDPIDHPVSQYEFDVLIGADGKRNTLDGFKRKEFRGKLAIAITANFINHRSEAEARVEEISGVAYIFNQKFFKDLRQATGIDLENIVYYKDDTHYFVMTAKKHSLLNKGVILNDYSDTAKLLAIENINKEALMDYASEAANFSTGYKLPQLQFAVNHYGQPDVAMFDFTSMYAAENASRVIQEKGYKLLMCLVGDSLLEPFWPTGSGCARGFLSSMDACWAVRSWGSSNYVNALEVLAERESIYRLLNQTTPENLSRDIANYMLDPHTRYPNLNTRLVLPIQVKSLYYSDDPTTVEQCLKSPSSLPSDYSKKRRRKDTQIHHDILLSWLKRQVALYDNIHIEDTSKSFKDGLVLCAILHRYRPDLIDFHSLDSSDIAGNNQLAFDILEKEYEVLPVMTGAEMAKCDVPDNLTMFSYLTQVYDIFRGEIPCIHHEKKEDELILEIDSNNQNIPSYKAALGKMNHTQKLSLLSRLTGSIPRKRYRESRSPTSLNRNNDAQVPRKPKKRKSGSSVVIEQRRNLLDRTKKEQIQKIDGHKQKLMTTRIQKSVRTLQQNKKQNNDTSPVRVKKVTIENNDERQQRLMAARIEKSVRMLQQNKRQDYDNLPFEDYTMFVYRQVAPDFKERVKNLEKKLLHPDREIKLQEIRRSPMEENFSGRVKDIETKLKEGNRLEKKPKDLLRAIGKIEKTDWNVKEIEKKIEENKHGRGMTSSAAKVPKWNRQQFDDKFTAVKKKLIDSKNAPPPDSKYSNVDKTLKQLEQKLKNGAVLEQGQRGANKVSAMAAQLTTLNQQTEEVPIYRSTSKNVIILNQGGSETCHFCSKRVYLMERLIAEGRCFHRGCFRCEYCGISLRLGNYNFDRDGKYGSRFYCTQHFGYPGVYRIKQKNKFNDNKNEPQHYEDKTPNAFPKTPASSKMKDTTDTPERVGFENLEIDKEDTGNVSINEMDEDEWTDHNFGASANELASSNDVSEISESDEEEEDNEDEFAQALDIPSIDNNESLEFTRRFPSSSLSSATVSDPQRKNNRFKVNNNDDTDSSCSGDDPNISYHAFESEEESNTATGERKSRSKNFGSMGARLKVQDRSNGTDSGSETEVASDEYSLTSDEDYDENKDDEDYDEEDDDDDDDYDDDDDDDEDSSEDDDSATEISTDSEFERNTSCVKSEIPDIVISESLPTRRGQLEDIRTIQVISKHIPGKSIARLKNDTSNESSIKNFVNNETILSRLPFVNPQRGDYHINRTQSTEGVASKISLELKKKYLLGGDNTSSLVKKSESTSVLDTKFKSLVDQISEHQKLLNPAPEPSQSMQTFLDSTTKSRNPALSPSNSINLRKSKELTDLDDFPHVCCQSNNFESINGANNELTKSVGNHVRESETDTSQTITAVTITKRPPSPIFETSIVVPQLPNTEQSTHMVSSSSENSLADELEDDGDLVHRDQHLNVQISLPKVEIHNSKGELLPQDTDVEEKCNRVEENVTVYPRPGDEKRKENSPNKIMAMPVADNNDHDAQILKHVSTPAALFFSNDPKDKNSFSDKSSPSTPTSLQGDDNTLAVFTETELSDWARDEDGAVSENFDELILGTPNITYRRHQKPKKRTSRTKKKIPQDDLVDDYVHICGKTERLKPPSFVLANLDDMDIEFMDTDDENTAKENSETVNPLLSQNRGYIEYVTSEDEAKTPLAEAINAGYQLFAEYDGGVNDSKVLSLIQNESPNTEDVTKPSQSDEYYKFVQRLQERITPFGNVKDSIDIRKSRKSPKSPSSPEKQPIIEEKIKVNTPSQKLEELSRERSKQKNLIHEMVMRKLQQEGKSIQDRKAKKNLRNSLCPLNSSQNSHGDPNEETKKEANMIENKENRPVSGDVYDFMVFKEPAKIIPSTPVNSEKYAESFSLPDIRKVLNDVDSKSTSAIIPPPSPAKLEVLRSTETIRQQARTRARLMSDSELGLSPEDKLKLLKQKIAARKAVQSAYVDYPKSDDYFSEKESYPSRMLDALNTAMTEIDAKKDSDEVTPRGKSAKEKDRKKSIIQAVSDFFLKKSPTKISLAKDNSPSTSNNKLKFKLNLMGKEKSKSADDVLSLFVEENDGKPIVGDIILHTTCASESNLKRKEEKLGPPRPPSPVGYVSQLDKSDESLSITTIQSHDEHANLSASKNLRSSNRKAKRENQKKLRMAQEIQRQLEEIEVKQKELEYKGVNVEKALRNNQNSESEFELMQELLDMIRERNELRKFEQKLLLKAKEIEAEDPYLH